MSLQKRTVFSVAWIGLATGTMALLNFGINATLARILSPADFGLMGIVLVITAFGTMLGDLGIATAVIHKKDITNKQLTTLFYLNLLVGVCLSLSCYWLASFFAQMFGHEELADILKVVSLTFGVASIGQVMKSAMQKEIRFTTLSIIDMIGGVFYGICSIVCAMRGLGVWSLIYGLLAKQISDVILFWACSSFKPWHGIDIASVKDMLNFGKYVYAEKFLGYFNGNFDNFLIGKFIGLEALGYYTLAYNLMLFPVFKIGGVVTQVAFPVFSMVQSNDGKIRSGYLKMIKYISILTFPIMGILLVAAPEFITLVYGAKWQPAVPLLQIFCFVGCARSIATTVGSVLYSKGRSDLSFKVNIFAALYHAVGFLIGIHWGVIGVAVAYGIIMLSFVPIYPYLLKSVIGLEYKSYGSALLPQLTGTVLTVVVLVLIRPFIGSSFVALDKMVILGSLTYFCFIFFGHQKLILDGLNLVGIGSKNKHKVLHYKDGQYLPLTETWIYHQIHFMEKYEPVIYCRDTANLEHYPTANIRSKKMKGRGFDLYTIVSKSLGWLLGFYPQDFIFISKDSPKLIHAHYGPAGYNLLKLKKGTGIPLVTTFYGFDANELPVQKLSWRSRYKKLFKEGDLFLVEGSHMKQTLVSLGCSADKVAIYHLGIDVQKIKYAPRGLSDGEGIRILIAGCFKEKKGIPDAISAFGQLVKKYPEKKLQLSIIGDSTGSAREDEEKRKILSIIDEYDLRSLVTLHGFKPYSFFIEELYKHHVFISPSVKASDGDAEGGAPVSIIEASASGMPVLSTRHCDIPEVILDGQSGYLVAERDREALFNKLENLVLHPEVWESLGLAGRKHIETNYNVHKQIVVLGQLYDRVLESVS